MTVDTNKLHDFAVSPNAYDYGSVFSGTQESQKVIENAMDRSRDWFPYTHSTLCFPGVYNIRNLEWHPEHPNHLTLVVNKPRPDNSHIQFFTVSILNFKKCIMT